MARKSTSNVITDLLTKYRDKIEERWIDEQLKTHGSKLGKNKEDFKENCTEFFDTILDALKTENKYSSILKEEDSNLKRFIAEFSKQRIVQGFSPGDTARYILNWRLHFFIVTQEELPAEEYQSYQEPFGEFNNFAEDLSLLVVELFVEERDEIINTQRNEIMELSTPVIKVWDGILALPIVGTLDSMRSQQLMESTLNEIVETGYTQVIIDISGVPNIDTLTAQHLIKTAAAIKLMGAKCIISGIRPEIATTIVGLGISLDEYSSTKATMADAIATAINEMGFKIYATKKS